MSANTIKEPIGTKERHRQTLRSLPYSDARRAVPERIVRRRIRRARQVALMSTLREMALCLMGLWAKVVCLTRLAVPQAATHAAVGFAVGFAVALRVMYAVLRRQWRHSPAQPASVLR